VIFNYYFIFIRVLNLKMEFNLIELFTKWKYLVFLDANREIFIKKITRDKLTLLIIRVVYY